MSTLPVRCTGSGWETTLVEKLEFVEMSARNLATHPLLMKL